MFGTIRLSVLILAALLFAPAVSSADTALQARLNYRKAFLLFKQKRWKQAQLAFQKTLQLLQSRHPKLKGRKKQFNTLGISDIHYHLALIALKLKKIRAACLSLQSLQREVKTLPSDPQRGWKTWQINPMLPSRFQDGNNQFQQRCARLPSRLTITRLPEKAVIQKQMGRQWLTVKQPLLLPMNTATLTIRLKFMAPGFLPKTLNVTLPRWSQKTIQVVLKKKPKPRLVVRPRIIPKRRVPPPPKTSPWVWVGVGLGAAAATAAIVAAIVVTQNQQPTAVQGSLNPSVWTD